MYLSNLDQASLAESAGKAFIAGEYDWTNRYHLPLLYLAVLAPALIAALIFLLPARWWPWRLSACWSRRRRTGQDQSMVPVSLGPPTRSRASLEGYAQVRPDSPEPKSADASYSTLQIPIIDTSRSAAPRASKTRSGGILIRRWHISLFFLALCPVLAGIIYVYLPQRLDKFVADLSTRSASSPPSSAGEFYWSLFGRDDQCCQFVQHHDGYTLHYAGQGDKRVDTLVRRAWTARGENPRFPRIACPQQTLTLPVNSTWTGTL